ncbi:hypothetical protein DFH29DRAFT_484466 [Suillus ampliporus]|nr:hypothetical protein DFH29DRAFT_484466 [Suillus ampliporus]
MIPLFQMRLQHTTPSSLNLKCLRRNAPTSHKCGVHAKKNRECFEDCDCEKTQGETRVVQLPSMNLNILYQILSFLRHMEPLNLSRTTKSFRSLLMQKVLCVSLAGCSSTEYKLS